MIIKFMEENKWVIFGEIDHLEYEKIDEAGPNSALSSDILCFKQGNSPAKAQRVQIAFFTKNMTEATIIHCYSPIYLMNDEGRTVETI